MSKTVNRLYLDDSSDDEEIGFDLPKVIWKASVIRSIKKVATNKKDISAVSSYILTETAQGLVSHPKSLETYRHKKREISDEIDKKLALLSEPLKVKLNELKIKLVEFSFYKFIPSLFIYNNSSTNTNSYTEGLLQSFYSKFEKDINNFVTDLYLSKVINLNDEHFKTIKKQYEGLVAKCANEALDFYSGSKKGVKSQTIIDMEETFFPEFVKKLNIQAAAGAKRGNSGSLKLTKLKAENLIKENITQSTPDTFFEFLLKSGITLGIKTIPEGITLCLSSLIKAQNLGVFIIQDIILGKDFDYQSYAEYSSIINMELRDHFSTRAFNNNFLEHTANILLNQKIVRHSQKVLGIEKLNDALHHSALLPNGMKTSSSIKVSSNGSRTDYITLPLKGRSSTYEALITRELEDKPYLSDLLTIIKTIIQDNPIEQANIQQGFLYKFTDLLFNCETVRGISAYMTIPMYFELVKAGLYQLSDLSHRLPIAIKADEDDPSEGGAVAAYRYMNDFLGGTYGGNKHLLTTRQYYDHKEGSETKAKELAIKDTILFLDWLIYKKILLDTTTLEYIALDGSVRKESISELTKLAYKCFVTIKQSDSQVNIKNTLQNVLESMDTYLAEVISGEKLETYKAEVISKTELESKKPESDSKEEYLLTSSVEKEEHVTTPPIASGTEINKLLFKSLHDLVFDWYGVNLSHLSFSPFEEIDSEVALSGSSSLSSSISSS